MLAFVGRISASIILFSVESPMATDFCTSLLLSGSLLAPMAIPPRSLTLAHTTHQEG
jgi:hypothetical protein